jgi:methylated-DNA-protein-cysteine methyltransferase-like protein
MENTRDKSFEKVYQLVRTIPKGKVTTYGSIAKELKMNPRTVGHILHLNPSGEVTPCHRVVNFKGRIAPGYAFGGQSIQKKRLEQEGVRFKDERHIDLKKYLYSF